MGWFSKAFGGVGDALEDAFSSEGITSALTMGAALAAGALTGGAGAAAIWGAAGIGAGLGLVQGGMQHHQAERAEEAQQAQIAAAQKAAEMQDPSRVVQQTTTAPIQQQQEQTAEINNASAKARKFSLSKTVYSSGLPTLGGGSAARKDLLG